MSCAQCAGKGSSLEEMMFYKHDDKTPRLT
jgi:hypothetical protein